MKTALNFLRSTLEIRDLRTFSGSQMHLLLEEEAREWTRRLQWDYEPSIKLLKQYLDARILPGLVALDRSTGEILGYCFSVYEGQKAVVGDVFCWPTEASGFTASEIQNALLRPMLETLQNTPGIHRVEAQLLLHDSESLGEVFREAGFTAYRRLFMQRNLQDGSLSPAESEAPQPLPRGIRLIRWTTSHFQQAGELVYRAYAGHGDSVINDQYESIHGALRFLHNIVRFPGCGIFDAEASWVLWDDHTQRMQGLLLCSVVQEGVAHMTQISMAPHLRGRGLGRFLVRHALAELRHRGFTSITLTVTERNTAAMKLYKSFGFAERSDFDAMVWVKA
jgi:ribosomal protein S18 acetylase RimI-like enzyme